MKKSVVILSLLIILTLIAGCSLNISGPSKITFAKAQETPQKGISLEPTGSVFNQKDFPLQENTIYSYGVIVRNYDNEEIPNVEVRITDLVDDSYGGLAENAQGRTIFIQNVDAQNEEIFGPTPFDYQNLNQDPTLATYQAFARYNFELSTGNFIKIPTIKEHCTSGRNNPEKTNLCEVRVSLDDRNNDIENRGALRQSNNNFAPINVDSLSLSFIPTEGNVYAQISFKLTNVGGGYIPYPEENPIDLTVSIDGFPAFNCNPQAPIMREKTILIQCDSQAAFEAGSANPQPIIITARYPYEIASGQFTREITRRQVQ